MGRHPQELKGYILDTASKIEKQKLGGAGECSVLEASGKKKILSRQKE